MVRSSGIRGYETTMRSLGVDPQELLRQYNISPQLLKNDETFLPLRSVIQLLEASARDAQCPDLGLRISMHQDIGILGILGVMLQNATTIQEALEYASRYLFLHGSDLSLSFTNPSPLINNAIEVIFEIRLKDSPPQRQTIDLCLSTMHRIIQWLCGADYKLKALTLPHTPIAPINDYVRFFGAPVIINQERAALHIGQETIFIQPHGANPVLREITEDYLTRNFRIPSDSFAERVRKAIHLNLGTTQTNKDAIAEMLALHPRTLQRRLHIEGTSFEEIKNNLIKDLILQYLRETKIPLSQLAGLLGFQEQSAFSRATKRWFGQSPKEIRSQHIPPYM